MTKITFKSTIKCNEIYNKHSHYHNKFKEGNNNVAFTNFFI